MVTHVWSDPGRCSEKASISHKKNNKLITRTVGAMHRAVLKGQCVQCWRVTRAGCEYRSTLQVYGVGYGGWPINSLQSFSKIRECSPWASLENIGFLTQEWRYRPGRNFYSIVKMSQRREEKNMVEGKCCSMVFQLGSEQFILPIIMLKWFSEWVWKINRYNIIWFCWTTVKTAYSYFPHFIVTIWREIMELTKHSSLHSVLSLHRERKREYSDRDRARTNIVQSRGEQPPPPLVLFLTRLV